MTTPQDFAFLETPAQSVPGNGGPLTPPLLESEIAQLLAYVPHGQMHPALLTLAGHFAAKLGPRLDEILAIIEPVAARWEQPVDLEKVRATITDVVDLERQKRAAQATSAPPEYEQAGFRETVIEPGPDMEPPPTPTQERKQAAGPTTAPGDATIGADAFLAPPPDLRYDIEGVRVQGDHGWTGGAPKSMKGLLSLEEARATATGTAFLGHFAARKGRVLYVSEEDRVARLHRRVYAMLKGREAREIPGAEDLRFLVKAGVRLDTVAGLEILRWHLARWRPEIVYLEHFDKLHSVDGNKTQDVKPLLDELDKLHTEFGCTFRIQKHNRKEAAGQSKRKGEMLAGSVSLFGWGESSVYLTLLRRGVAQVETEGKDGDMAPRFLVLYQAGKVIYGGEVQGGQQEEKREAVLKLVEQHPGATTAEVANALDVTERTARSRLKALERDRLVDGKAESSKHPKRWWIKSTRIQSEEAGKQVGFSGMDISRAEGGK